LGTGNIFFMFFQSLKDDAKTDKKKDDWRKGSGDQ
jgi:hypothetical protein